MLLIKNIEIYSPEYLGKKDLLIVDRKIILIEDNLKNYRDKIKIINGKNKILIPGLIDNHIYSVDSEEGSIKKNVSKIAFPQLIKGGITTVVELMDTYYPTDNRNIEDLVKKVEVLKEEGISAYVYTGGYKSLQKFGKVPVYSLLNELKKMVKEEGFKLDEALKFFTSNVSKALHLYPDKGIIAENSDADLLILDKDMNLDSVIARGKLMMEEGQLLVKGTYE